MSIIVGSSALQAIDYEGKQGATLIVGGQIVWAELFDDFLRADQAALTSPWVIETTLNSWHVGVSGRVCRMMVPDGLGIGLPITDAARHSTVLSADDGHLEVQIANLGDPGFHTKVWRRYSNTGGGYGVGIDIMPARVQIAYRDLSIDLPVANCGIASTGDKLRLIQEGYKHTLLRNGTDVGAWDDTLHLSQKGASYRSVAIHMQGAKQSLGPRRFSPSLNYIEAA